MAEVANTSGRDDFLEWIEATLRPAEDALHDGDPGPRLALWSTHEQSGSSPMYRNSAQSTSQIQATRKSPSGTANPVSRRSRPARSSGWPAAAVASPGSIPSGRIHRHA